MNETSSQIYAQLSGGLRCRQYEDTNKANPKNNIKRFHGTLPLNNDSYVSRRHWISRRAESSLWKHGICMVSSTKGVVVEELKCTDQMVNQSQAWQKILIILYAMT